MTITEQPEKVTSVRLSELPERTFVELTLVYNADQVSSLLGFVERSVFIGAYTTGSGAAKGRINISAKTVFLRYGGGTGVVRLSRASVNDLLVVGERVILEQTLSDNKDLREEMYVSRIAVVEPAEPRTIDLFSLPAGTIVHVRSASTETALFITGSEPEKCYGLDGEGLQLFTFQSSIPSDDDAAVYRLPVQQYLVEGERFGRMVKVLNAHIIEP